MIRTKKVLALSLGFLLCTLAFSQTSQRLLYKEPGAKPQLAPDTELGADCWKGWYSNHSNDPVFLAEAVYTVQKKPGTEGISQIDVISRIGRQFSTMEGIEYYSNTRKKMAVLYDECYTVTGPNNRGRIADRTEGSADGKTIYYIQKDKSFGRALYGATYRQTETELCFSSKNMDALSFTMFKAVKPEDLYLNLLITEQDDSFTVYILAQADFASIPMIDQFLEKSFMARLDAVYTWFKESYYEN